MVVSAGKINPLFSWEEAVLGETVIRQVSDLTVSAVRYEVEGAIGVGDGQACVGRRHLREEAEPSRGSLGTSGEESSGRQGPEVGKGP